MSLELWMLLLASVLGLVHLAAASFSFKAQVGNKYTVGPRDEDLQPTGMAGRLRRAHVNFMETYPIFAVCVFIAHLTGTNGSLSTAGALLYVIGRFAFLPLYAAGVPWWRTLSWKLATLGLGMVGAQVVVGKLQ